MKPASLLPEWLIPAASLLIGAGAALSVWGGRSDKHIELQQQLAKFLALDEEQRHDVRLSFADFKAQSDSRKTDIESVHDAVQKDPILREAMERYYRWWSSLDQHDWDAFQEMNSDDRLEFVRTRINAQADESKQIVVEFLGPLPPLHMTFEEFGKILRDALASVEKPDALQEELEALDSERHRTLRLALWIFEDFKTSEDPQEKERRGKLLQAAVLNHVSDTTWKDAFTSIHRSLSGKQFESGWLFMTLFSILSAGTVTLGEELHDEFPVTDEQVKDAFANLEDKELQQSLMKMSADEARTRLQFLVQTNGRSPEQRLLIKYIEFATERERTFRRATFGFDGRGPFQPERDRGAGNPRNGRPGQL
jgi:hypothetical protein